jgi:hypothetical protein
MVASACLNSLLLRPALRFLVSPQESGVGKEQLVSSLSQLLAQLLSVGN